MKCDHCKYRTGEAASMDYPYPVEYCLMGHWEGGCLEEDAPKIDPWKDCKDFETDEQKEDKTRKFIPYHGK